MSNIIIQNVFRVKRGIIIGIHDLYKIPKIGEVYSCGVDSWVIRGREKSNRDPESSSHAESYLFFIKPVNGSKPPKRGYVLDKVK